MSIYWRGLSIPHWVRYPAIQVSCRTFVLLDECVKIKANK